MRAPRVPGCYRLACMDVKNNQFLRDVWRNSIVPAGILSGTPEKLEILNNIGTNGTPSDILNQSSDTLFLQTGVSSQINLRQEVKKSDDHGRR